MDKLTKERLGALLILVFCIVYAISSVDIALPRSVVSTAFTPRSMPYLLSAVGIGLALVLLMFSPKSAPLELARYRWPQFAWTVALMVVYGLLLKPLGFVLATTLFLFVGFKSLGARSAFFAAMVAVGVSATFWLLMQYGLDVYVSPWPQFTELS